MIPDKMPVGVYKGGHNKFSTRELQLQKNDLVYVFTDGYPDQFGGEHLPGGKAGGKKFKEKNLQKLLLEIHHKSLHDQVGILRKSFADWKGPLEQIDDVCVMGMRI